jgi:hypothetical protein
MASLVGGELYGTIRSLSKSVVRRERMSIDLTPTAARSERIDSFGHGGHSRDTLHQTCLQLAQVTIGRCNGNTD